MAYRHSELGEQVTSDPTKAAKTIIRAAKKVDGIMTPLADELGVNRATLYRWIETLDNNYAQNVRATIDGIRTKKEERDRKAKFKALNQEMRDSLTLHDGHIKATAQALGISENAMYVRIRNLEEQGFKIKAFAAKLRKKRSSWRVFE